MTAYGSQSGVCLRHAAKHGRRRKTGSRGRTRPGAANHAAVIRAPAKGEEFIGAKPRKVEDVTMFNLSLESVKSMGNLNVAVSALNKLGSDARHAEFVAAETAARQAANTVNEDIKAAVYAALRNGGRGNVVRSIIDAGGTIPAVSVKRGKDGGYYADVAPAVFDLAAMESHDKALYAAAPGWAPSAVAVGWRVLKYVAGGLAINKQAAADNVASLHVAKTTAAALKDGDNAITSNTQLIAALQSVIDKIYFVPGDNGENVYKVRTQDARFFRECLAKEGKGINGVACATDATIRRLVWKVLCNCIAGTGYTLDK